MSNWTAKANPRIWRSPQSDFNGDEPLNALDVYTDQTLARIASHGFNAVWLRGRLRDLMQSTIFPQLNRPNATRRLENISTLIQRGRRNGIEIFLYFNEPLALSAADPFWAAHPDLKGQPHQEPISKVDVISLCTSVPTVQQFFAEAVTGLFQSLTGLGGVILITASEYHTHCWSHYARYSLSDGIVSKNDEPMQCPRCRDREPADIVTELLGVWSQAAGHLSPRPRVLAWNWSWSIWYPEPQAEVIERLPPGVELQLDWERGGSKRMFNRDIPMDEYSLGYPGPSPRCMASIRCAQRSSTPVHAKLQMGTTHEIATVPNLPLMQNLHAKFAGLYREGIAGVMACWNFGCSLTLNSFALGLFCDKSKQSLDREWFLKELAQAYFGPVDHSAVVRAWSGFCAAFDHFPFSIKMLYFGPVNYAPAYPLTSEYRTVPMGPSWVQHHPFGDRLADCFGPFSLDEIIEAYRTMSDLWDQGLAHYTQALTPATDMSAEHLQHTSEELSCARMIGCQLRCTLDIFRFHRWRVGVIAAKGLHPPCKVPLDGQAMEILKGQIANAQEALILTEADNRFGFHQEPQAQFYSPELIQSAIEVMNGEIKAAGQ